MPLDCVVLPLAQTGWLIQGPESPAGLPLWQAAAPILVSVQRLLVNFCLLTGSNILQRTDRHTAPPCGLLLKAQFTLLRHYSNHAPDGKNTSPSSSSSQDEPWLTARQASALTPSCPGSCPLRAMSLLITKYFQGKDRVRGRHQELRSVVHGQVVIKSDYHRYSSAVFSKSSFADQLD